jgi:sugar phosphate isomerase/epimerase
MTENARVVLSALADEAAIHKTAVEQFSALAALGLQYYTIRFIDVGGGIKNVMKLTKSEITKVRHLEDEYELNVASIGSPIGKVKLRNVQDGTENSYVPFKKYIGREVKKACDLAHAFETKLIRGFSFYPPHGSDPWEHISQAADQLGQIAEACHRSDLTYGLEVEANLVGQTGQLMAELHRQVNHPAMVLIFDAANILCQGFTSAELYEQYLAMKPGIGWFHIKDYHDPKPTRRQQYVNEEMLKHFVPADVGDAAHESILRDFRESLPKLERRLRRRGIPGVVFDLEPHVKGGGQFGGFSGPDGMGVALRGFCRVLDYVGIDYHLRDMEDIRAARGF